MVPTTLRAFETTADLAERSNCNHIQRRGARPVARSPARCRGLRRIGCVVTPWDVGYAPVRAETRTQATLSCCDNTATDTLEKLVGGPAVVTQWVHSQGITGLRLDRDTAGLIRDFYGLPPGPSFPDSLAAGLKANPALEEKGDKPDPKFDNDPRDTSTPTAMAELLERIYTGKALSPASTNLLREIQERNTTGKARIRARLPEGTVVAEKTGTIGGSVNNVGVITLPGNAGKLIVAVFIKKSSKPVEERERVIADIGRALYDYYLFEAHE